MDELFTLIGGSKEKKPSGRVGSIQVDPVLSSNQVEIVKSHQIVLPDHLKEVDDSNKMNQGSELDIDPNSFNEAAAIRGEIKEAQLEDSSLHQELGKASV